jgi:hypothetical protein
MTDKVKIQLKPNGSIRVTGEVDFVDSDGNALETKANFSLCRCGHSATKPSQLSSASPDQKGRSTIQDLPNLQS